MSASRRKGTAAESAVVGYLREHGFPSAERRAMAGVADKGDVSGIVGVVIEVKSCARMELGQWVDEAEAERANAGAVIGVVWHRRRGRVSPGAWYVTMTGEQFVRLIGEGE